MREYGGIYEYGTVSGVKGSLLVVERVRRVAYDEVVEVVGPDGNPRIGRVLEAGEGYAVVQVLTGTEGLDIKRTRVRFLGETLKIPVSTEMLGRIFNGRGEPLDKLPEPIPEDYLDVNGEPLNPASRLPPSEFIQTGISVIDGMNSLVRGQKLPIFSGSGLPHNRLAAQIARQATIPGREEGFAVVFAAIGIKHDEALYFIEEFRRTGALSRLALFLNLANDPVAERLLTPRIALTLAEYLAFHQDMHVLVVLTDMTNYCEALREVSVSREEIPGRRGYPGYMYSDLASIYERAGRVRGRSGSVTQMPILTMPGDDMTHPIPDLTGYITEGQIVLGRDLHEKGIYPPVNVLMSLSRMMRKGIGAGKTREDHANVSDQLYASYARAIDLRGLAAIVGESSLSPVERRYLSFADRFEREFLNQGEYENRTIERTLEIAWDVLSELPEEELTRVKPAYIRKYYRGRGRVGA